jgi:hypothetical protein
MKRLVLPLAAALFLVFFAWADEGEAVSAADKAKAFKCNRKLVETMVESGILLASEESPLKRAEHCNVIARCLADEIGRAALAHEGSRAQELGGHLHTMLQDGVAGNLRRANAVPLTSPGQDELKRIHKDVRDLTQSVLKLTPDDDETREQLQQVRKSVEEGRREVESILHSLRK